MQVSENKLDTDSNQHKSRRIYITNLATRVVGVRTLMALAGHKAISSTQHYIDVNDETLRRAVELI
jgi:integrase/recombinase XerD